MNPKEPKTVTAKPFELYSSYICSYERHRRITMTSNVADVCKIEHYKLENDSLETNPFCSGS